MTILTNTFTLYKCNLTYCLFLYSTYLHCISSTFFRVLIQAYSDNFILYISLFISVIGDLHFSQEYRQLFDDGQRHSGRKPDGTLGQPTNIQDLPASISHLYSEYCQNSSYFRSQHGDLPYTCTCMYVSKFVYQAFFIHRFSCCQFYPVALNSAETSNIITHNPLSEP